MDVRRYELRWTHHQSTVVAEVGSLYRDAALVDVTLACEDQRTYQAHKLVLSACSQYFQGLFARHSTHHHPIIFLKDVSGEECEALLTYMYRGEVSVGHDQIHRILRVANSLQIRGLAEMETSSSRPSSPALGDRGGHCPSSSPSPSTGPPTKCVSPCSEPPSPNPIPPLINPQNHNGGSAHNQMSSHHSGQDMPPHTRHLSVAAVAAAAVAAVGVHSHPPSHPHIPPDYSSHFPLLHHRPYDLSASALAASSDSERKRAEESTKGPPVTLPTSSFTPQLRVKQDLGCNSWEGPGVDIGGVSPLSLGDTTRHPYLPPAIFSSFLAHEQQSVAGNQAYGRMFPISDPLRRLDRLGSNGGETRIHKCQYCSRKFKRKDHLKTHVRIHTGERPYKCKICGRGFIQSQQVKIHMKVHVREESSGVGGSGLGLGGSGTSLPSLYPELGGHFSDHKLGVSGNSSGGGAGGCGSLSEPHNSHHDDNDHPIDSSLNHPDLDSENSSSGDVDYEMKYDIRGDRSAGGNGIGHSPSMSCTSLLGGMGGEHKTPSPQSPPRVLSRNHPLPDDQSCSVMSLKETYHISSNIKK